MITFINKRTGGIMLVAEDRVEEYKAAGHKLAADPVVTEKAPAKKPARKKGTSKK